MVRLVHPDYRALDLASVFDPFMNFDHLNFSKARILKLLDDLDRSWIHSVREGHPADRTVRPACILPLTALDTASSDEPGQ